MNRVVLSGSSVRLFCFVQAKTLCRYGCMYFLAALVLVCVDVIVMSSCRCCMFVSCVHPVTVLNAAFCMTCSLSMLVEDAIGDHTEEAYYRAGLITAL